MSRIKLTLKDIFDLDSAVLYNPDEFKPVSNVIINSKLAAKGSLFVAIKGRKFDGHDFAIEAIKNGSSAIVINENKFALFKDFDVPVILVKNTITALGELAGMWRKKLNAKVIGITGSSGKTTTKEILAAILSEKYKVQKTILNNNNHIGVPLTIFSTNEKHDILVAEVGTNHFGEVLYSAKILQPDFALITNIGDSHLEFLKNKKGVLKEKSALFNETIERSGKIFVNYDDPLLKNFKADRRSIISFGINNRAITRAKISGFSPLGKPVVKIFHGSQKMKFELPMYGEMSARNFVAAVAVAIELGITAEQINNSLPKLKISPHRLESFEFPKFLLIDDSYNANPDSMKAAIKILSSITKYRRKILVIGDMLELGDKENYYHAALSGTIERNKISEVYTLGRRMKLLNELIRNKKIFAKHFTGKKSLINYLQKINLDDSVMLIKGSRGMKMEELAEIIKIRFMN